MTAHALATGRAATLVKLAFAAGARLSAAFSAFGLTALVTRNMPNDEAGLFLLALTMITVLSIFFRLGLDNVILRLLSAHNVDAFAQEKLNRGLLWITTATIPATILAMLFSKQIAVGVFNKPDFEPILYWMLPALPSLSLFFLLSFAFQAQHRVVLTSFFQNLGISALFIAGFGFLWFYQPETIGGVTSAQLYSLSAITIFIAAFTLWFSQKNITFRLHKYRDSELSEASKNLWMAAIMGVAVQWAGIIVAGIFLSAEDVALLTAAQRAALLVTFILMVVNTVVAPKYASLWSRGELNKIHLLAKWSTRGVLVLATPILFIMIIWSGQIMGLFGEGFSVGAPLLVILTIGQFVNVLTGSVGYLLNMTGNERTFRNISIVTGAVSLALCYFIIPVYGVIGAASTIAISGIIINVSCLVLVKIKLGFWTVG